MKKLLSALLAAAMTACAVCVPASAYSEDIKSEEMLTSYIEYHGFAPVYALGEDVSAYQVGDVNMDGVIDAKDANLVQIEYNLYSIVNVGHILDENQRVLADFAQTSHNKYNDPIDLSDAGGISHYAVYQLVESGVSLEEFRELWDSGRIKEILG